MHLFTQISWFSRYFVSFVVPEDVSSFSRKRLQIKVGKIVKLLTDRVTDVNSKNYIGETPLSKVVLESYFRRYVLYQSKQTTISHFQVAWRMFAY